MKKDNSIKGVSDMINIPEEVIKDIVSKHTTNETNINMDKYYPDDDVVKNMSFEDIVRDICEKGDIDEKGAEKLIYKYRNNKIIDITEEFDNTMDDLVSNIGKLRELVRDIVNRDLTTKISNLDYIEPAQCNVYINHVMCHIYEENPDNINDRFSGRLDVSFISNRSSDNIVSINVSNFIKCYTKSNTVKNYHISYEVLIWCYLDEYDIDSLIKFIFDNTTRRVISEFNFNELDDTIWCLPTTMRHIKKIANKYSGLIKYSNTKFSNGASEMSTINMTFNLGEYMNTAVSEFNNEFSDLDDEDDDEDYLDDEDEEEE